MYIKLACNQEFIGVVAAMERRGVDSCEKAVDILKMIRFVLVSFRVIEAFRRSKNSSQMC